MCMSNSTKETACKGEVYACKESNIPDLCEGNTCTLLRECFYLWKISSFLQCLVSFKILYSTENNELFTLLHYYKQYILNIYNYIHTIYVCVCVCVCVRVHRRLWGELIGGSRETFLLSTTAWRGIVARCLPGNSDRTRGNGLKLHHKRFRWGIR